MQIGKMNSLFGSDEIRNSLPIIQSFRRDGLCGMVVSGLIMSILTLSYAFGG
jgi:hypothetical protein